MNSESSPLITSFVIRFVHEKTAEPADLMTWRGAIRHVQSEQELTFTQWGEALEFMEQFLPANAFDQPQQTDPDVR